jgi:hypothetical protein
MTGAMRDICAGLLRYITLLAEDGHSTKALHAGRFLLQQLGEQLWHSFTRASV